MSFTSYSDFSYEGFQQSLNLAAYYSILQNFAQSSDTHLYENSDHMTALILDGPYH